MPTYPDGEHADDDAENADFKGWRSLSSLLRRRGRGLLTGRTVFGVSSILAVFANRSLGNEVVRNTVDPSDFRFDRRQEAKFYLLSPFCYYSAAT